MAAHNLRRGEIIPQDRAEGPKLQQLSNRLMPESMSRIAQMGHARQMGANYHRPRKRLAEAALTNAINALGRFICLPSRLTGLAWYWMAMMRRTRFSMVMFISDSTA